jgi:hypothetical protein
MMQRSYGKLVLRTRKEGITISKAYIRKLLKEVRDEVLQPSVIIGSFSTCGYFPISFPLSYAFKQMPPPPLVSEEDMVVVVDVILDKIEDNETAIRGVDMDPLTPKPRSRRSPSHLFLVAPLAAGQPSSKQNPLGSVRQHMHVLVGQATPRRVANIWNDMLHHAHRATGRNAMMAALVDVIHLQTEVIEGQGAHHVMDTEYAGHLKGQLANRTKQKDRGTILKYGHGAMTTEVLLELIAEQYNKEADELEAAEKRDEKKEEAAVAKETRKRENAVEKEKKQLADAETKQIKVVARIEKAQQAVATKARGKGRGTGRPGRGGRGQGGKVPKTFPLDFADLMEASDSVVTPPVLVGRGRGTGRGRGRGVFIPVLKTLDEGSSDENITEDDSDTREDSDDPPNSQGGSRSPPTKSLSTSDNDEKNSALTCHNSTSWPFHHF